MARHNLKPEVASKLCALLPTLKRCSGQLRRGDRFCVNGALCELYRRETGDGVWLEDGSFFGALAGSDRVDPPYGVVEWALDDENESVFEINGRPAWHLNDSGWSFSRFVKALGAQ